MSILLTVKNVSKVYKTVYGREIKAISNFSLNLSQGEILTIVGPSGSGKSTLLYIISGIENPTSGQVEFFGNSDRPRIGFVFQTNSIFPWRTVEKNLTYALELMKVEAIKRKEKATALCQLIRLDPDIFLKKYPKELSGGEARRVAMGMSLANDPNLLLLDEPTSHLDYITQWSVQNTIQGIWLKNKFSIVVVTHNIDEAIFLGDRVLIMDNGVLQAALEINLPRPREDVLRNSETFNVYREQISTYHRKGKD
jgi:ABC-type nitrate/sulfonate/bicarbonate transport system ATPase subunit